MSDPVVVTVPSPQQTHTLGIQPLVLSTYPKVHGLVGAQFGDLEFDVGKSVRWLDWYADDLFIVDVNSGDQRYWIVNWTESFPGSEHIVTARSFFASPAEAALWRKEQFEWGSKKFNYHDDDWVLWIDAHEGISFDNRSLPDDYNASPFMSWIYREIERAQLASRDYAVLPYFAYLKYSDLQNITYGTIDQGAIDAGIPAVSQAVSVPWYLPAQGLTRLWKVGALRVPGFDWTVIDRLVDWDVAPGTGIPYSPGYLTPMVGQASIPDPGALPNEFTIVAKVSTSVNASAGLCGQWNGALRFLFSKHSGNGRNEFGWYTTSTQFFGANGQVVPTTGTPVTFAAAVTLNNGSGASRITAHDYINNARVTGATVTGAVAVLQAAGTPQLNVGNFAIVGGTKWPGRIYSIEMRTGLDPAGGTIIWRFDADEYPGIGTSYTDPRGRTWTLTSAAAITPKVSAVPAAPAVKLQIVSYGYAHWNIQDIVPPATTVPALDANNDDGWRMRNLLSRIRPIATIPYGATWQNPSTDPAGYPGPWCVDTTSNLDASLATSVEEDGHTPPAAQTEMLRVPLYDTVMRLNLRDGLWYESGASGNIPLAWDDVNQVWVPRYSPEQWAALGVGSNSEDEPPPSPMSLQLTGAGYCRAADSNDFDLGLSFTNMAILSLDDWTPTGRQAIVSKWGAAGQRSWYWAVETGGGQALVISRDGTASVEFLLPLAEFVPLADDQPVAIGVSFITIVEDEQDEVVFWHYVDPAWVPLHTVRQPNVGNEPIFNSTYEVQVGAVTASTMRASGLFRLVSIRQGAKEGGSEFGGSEVARMRGDITSNPSYDRYGHLWSNQGTWAYAPMPAPPNPLLVI